MSMSELHLSQFNWVDVSILVVIALSMLISFMRGFVKEIISIFIWVAALFLALHYSAALSNHFTAIHSDQARYALAFAAIIVLTLIVGVVVNALISMAISATGISMIDRGLGLFFGAARGILLVAVCLMLLQFTGMKIEAVKRSPLVHTFKPLVTWLDEHVPAKLDDLTDGSMFDDLDINSDDSGQDN